MDFSISTLSPLAFRNRSVKKKKMATVCIEVHLKKGYDEWKKLFDEDGVKRASMCDESKTTAGKVSDKLAIVLLHNVDMEKMGAFISNEEFQKMIEPVVEKHVTYTCSPLGPP